MTYDRNSQFENRLSLKSHHQHGFTMIELMLSVAFIVILLGIAVPSFEGLAYGSASNRKILELISDLELTRMKAIRTDQRWSVVFNDPAPNQYSIYNVTTNTLTKTVTLDPKQGRLAFDNAPPGGVAAPDPSFAFTNQGFIQPGLGAVTGNIYIVDNQNQRRFGISTTAAGVIVERRWTGAAWTGPTLVMP